MRIKRDKLIKMYETLSNKEICEQLGVTQPTLTRILKDNGIELKGAAGRVKKVVVVD